MRIILSLFLLLCCIQTGKSQSLYQSMDEYSDYSILIEAGIAVPQGQLKNKMDISPAVGLWFRNAFTNRSKIGIGGALFFPKKTWFWYQNRDVETYTIPFAGMFGLRMDHSFELNNRKDISLSLNSILGVGFYSYYDFDKEYDYEEWPDWKKEEEDKPSFTSAFATIHTGLGISLNFWKMGVFARYNYAPYGLFTKRVNQEFGSQHINFGLSYRF